ncbi:MAG: UDP-N-acetylglucosamine 2-epimerase [Bdellovibrionales bacterium GWA2_49_15]|nr:MAG: UDP-N-acetylglucosamine 2-epimerase [Bdellovibrionales bacterium GWA2_49_15]HAZ11705.1 UDP-N-acetylglucosamine 2-epimerase (non-hydrolyzing) [Bdellovibrionales bacterium]
MPLKIMTILGTRPEIIKLSRIVAEIEKHMTHVLVHTGQNFDYELNEVFFKDLEVRKPDYFLGAADKEKSVAQTIGLVISKCDEVLEKEKPDAVLIYGDTNSALSVIAAKRRKIPIFHMEAGNRCFDERVPEEINRKIVDHLSDINMVHSEHARRYLHNEGLKPETIIKTGSPMKEVLTHYAHKIDGSDVMKRMNLRSKDFFVVSTHREENVDCEDNFRELLDSLNKIAKNYKKRIIVSTHPRTRDRLSKLGAKEFDERIEFLKPMGFFEYVKLQKESFCVLSDSGTITEESSILKFPAVMLRKAHERPEGMDVGAVIMSGLETSRVIDSIKMAVDMSDQIVPNIEAYDNLQLSRQVVRIIQSYTDYINRTVWKKSN